MTATIHHGDCLDVLRAMPDNSVDAVVCDPPYGLSNTTPEKVTDTIVRWAQGDREHVPQGRGFMGAPWDAFVPPVAVWDECLRVLKPGGHLVAFAGSRTQDLMGLAIRLAGFDLRDTLMWVYGSGMPKSLNISKAIDKARDEDLEPAAEVARFLVQHMEARGVTRSDVNVHFGHSTAGSGAAQQWTTTRTDRSSKPRVPKWEQWQNLREWLDMPADMDDTVWRLNGNKGKPGEDWGKREVVGTQKGSMGRGNWRAMEGRSDQMPEEFNVTASATAEAKQWEGWGTLLKPSNEPIILARKPFPGTVAANVLTHGTGALNIDQCRIGNGSESKARVDEASQDERYTAKGGTNFAAKPGVRGGAPNGRWPSNVLLDPVTAEALDQQSGTLKSGALKPYQQANREHYSGSFPEVQEVNSPANEGGASRFFFTADYTPEEKEQAERNASMHELFSPSAVADQEDLALPAVLGSVGPRAVRFEVDKVLPVAVEPDPPFMYAAKAPKRERPSYTTEDGQTVQHATVKPLSIMQWLVKLVTPEGGTVLDPFAGSGTTVEAAILEGFNVIGIEREAAYLPLIQQRIDRANDVLPMAS